jgi:1-acyl-sn-glycerol-3-phosphate acyltransferase
LITSFQFSFFESTFVLLFAKEEKQRKPVFMRILRTFYTFVLSRRYKVDMVGLDLIKTSKGKLILPNHVSHIDPQMIATYVNRYTWVVPVVSERFFKIPIVGWLMRKWEAVPVADFRRGNRDLNVMKDIFKGVNEALSQDRSCIVYPSGELADGGFEKIRNKQAAHNIVSGLPEGVKVIGCRVQGLWGSMWSKAWKGRLPKFLPTYLKGVFYWFANFIFFCPKRNVTIEFVDITENAKLQAQNGRKVFNDFLEDFYNANGEEEPVYVKHFFYFPKPKRKLPPNLPRYKNPN